MTDQEKIQMIKEYLESQLPGSKVRHKDTEHFEEKFMISYEKQNFSIIFAEAFFADHSIKHINSWLESSNILAILRKNPNCRVPVDKQGTVGVPQAL